MMHNGSALAMRRHSLPGTPGTEMMNKNTKPDGKKNARRYSFALTKVA
jgi:hypothetical protein